MTETPNPERRSNAAMWCLSIGVALMVVSWFLGVGGVISAAASGGDPWVLGGGVFALALMALCLVGGGVLSLVGIVWIFVQVIADARGEDKDRYKNVER
jgi:hypothetical protein